MDTKSEQMLCVKQGGSSFCALLAAGGGEEFHFAISMEVSSDVELVIVGAQDEIELTRGVSLDPAKTRLIEARVSENRIELHPWTSDEIIDEIVPSGEDE